MNPVTLAARLNTSTPEAAGRHTRLLHAAQQFEAVMLSELMKPLSTGGAIGDDQAQASPMQSFGVESLAGAMARSGTFGFAERIVHTLEKRD